MNKLVQAARQALEALEVYEIKLNSRLCNEAITALREALAEQATVSGGLCGGCAKKAADGWALYCVECWEQAEQEPVIGAYEVVNEKGDEWSLVYPAAVHRYKSIPEERITQTFYAAPVRTKDLTDDEIESIVDGVGAYEVGYWHYAFARAVLAAYKEKNK